MNVSGSGASLSFGGPGATLNLSSRGSRATFGIPGTGLSFGAPLFRPQEAARRASAGPQTAITSAHQLVEAVRDPRATVVYAKSQRRLSASQLAAAHRELARREHQAHAQQEVERIEAEEQAVLESWRDAADVLSAEEQARALCARPYVSAEPPPKPPHYASAETVFRERIVDEARSSSPLTSGLRAIGPALGATAALAVGGVLRVTWQGDVTLTVVIATAFGVALAVIIQRLVQSRWERGIQSAAQKRSDVEWPSEHARIEAAYSDAKRAYEERDVQARTAWDAAERECQEFCG